MPLKLIGMKGSLCTARPLLLLAEKGITDFEFQDVDFASGENKSEAHLALQPFGQVPALDDNGFILFESRAICRYLASKFADRGPSLLPAAGDDKAWALFEQWASVEINSFDVFAQQIVVQKLVMPMMGRAVNEEVVAANRKILSDKFVAFDRILGKQAYMGGDGYSLIDVFYMPVVGALFGLGEAELITKHPNVKAWWDRVSAREAFQKASK
ncbi:putative glutathione-S-transferase theta, GST [Corynespora cassiicola Philippines]|uniref:glutathione transferase n=1 Tax=Corynespora cassiicola Philippines TaxID=1448308 RepID=A0A2T2NW37_CORCC|nr:putative glutathione-S-transferase theta, GST [Corynespora cassiicola Philippines]